jgi:hypothetical protein
MPEKSQRAGTGGANARARLGFSGMAANLWGEKLINTDDQSKYIAEFKKNCEFARDLAIGGVRVDTVQPPTILREVDPATAMDRVVKTWKTCCDIAADYGLSVCWEFEPGFAFNKPGDVRAHSRRRRQAQFRNSLRHLPRPDGGRDGRAAGGREGECSPARWNSSAC